MSGQDVIAAGLWFDEIEGHGLGDAVYVVSVSPTRRDHLRALLGFWCATAVRGGLGEACAPNRRADVVQ